MLHFVLLQCDCTTHFLINKSWCVHSSLHHRMKTSMSEVLNNVTTQWEKCVYGSTFTIQLLVSPKQGNIPHINIHHSVMSAVLRINGFEKFS